MHPVTRVSLAIVAVLGLVSACVSLPAQDKAALQTESQLTASAYCDLVLDGGLGVRAKIRTAHVETIGVLRRNGVDAGDGSISCP